MKSRILKCDICLGEGLTDRSELPVGWIVDMDTSMVLCDYCIIRWKEKFGAMPVPLMTGGEPDPQMPLYDLDKLHKEEAHE